MLCLYHLAEECLRCIIFRHMLGGVTRILEATGFLNEQLRIKEIQPTGTRSLATVAMAGNSTTLCGIAAGR